MTAAATALWLGPFRPPLTYVSFGFFQPLFLGALAGGTVLIETVLRGARGQIARQEAIRRVAVLAVAAAALLPFAGPLAAGLIRGLGYVVGKTSEVAGGSGYVSYPRDWLKGIFEARPALRRRTGARLEAAFGRVLSLPRRNLRLGEARGAGRASRIPCGRSPCGAP